MKKVLRDYQIEDLAFMINNPRILNRSEPATGKTGSACAYAWYVWRYEQGATIFLQPKSIIRKNFDEMLAFTDFEEDDLFIFDPKKIHKLRRAPKVILTTADTLSRHWEVMRTIAAAPVKLCLADEVHLYYSTHDSKRTQFWYQVMKQIPRLEAMTGTAIRGRMDSAYPIIQVIEPRYYGTYGRFMQEHAVQDYTGKVVGWANHLKLGQILLQHGINRTFKECYGAEKKVIIPVPLEMSAKHAALYKEFHELGMLELESEDILTSANEGVHVIRCRQILNHPESMSLSGWDPKETLAKDDWILNEFCGQYNSGLIFAVLQPEQRRLTAMLEKAGLKVALINGSVSMNRRAEIDQQFQEGKIDWIVASDLTAGVGFNWQRAEAVAFASCGYMDDAVTQAYRRAIRGVRETALPIYFPQYLDSVEPKILGVVERKSRLAAAVDKTRDPLEGLAYHKPRGE